MQSGFRSRFFRVFRVTVLVLALTAGTQWLRRSFTSVASEQALINAEIMEIRAPISGELEIGDVKPGAFCRKDDVLFTVKDPRFADRESVALYNEIENMVESQKSDLLGAKQNLDTTTIAHTRAERLYKAELIARIEFEDAQTHYEMAKKLLGAKTEQLQRLEARAREMEPQLQMAKACVVRMPIDGLVWAVSGKMGEQFEANKPVLEIINPDHIWVDAFFPERDAKDLKPGLEGQVTSLDSEASWPGRLRSMRAGVGRLAYDTSVAVPPPELVKRQVAVRVEPAWRQPFSATEFFGVGRSVKVVFNQRAPSYTVADALLEKWLQFFSTPKETVASAKQ
jgi:multidrug resistance efflux pump